QEMRRAGGGSGEDCAIRASGSTRRRLPADRSPNGRKEYRDGALGRSGDNGDGLVVRLARRAHAPIQARGEGVLVGLAPAKHRTALAGLAMPRVAGAAIVRVGGPEGTVPIADMPLYP